MNDNTDIANDSESTGDISLSETISDTLPDTIPLEHGGFDVAWHSMSRTSRIVAIVRTQYNRNFIDLRRWIFRNGKWYPTYRGFSMRSWVWRAMLPLIAQLIERNKL